MAAAETAHYGGVARTLHWLVALLVILLLIAGRIMEDLPLPQKEMFVMVHSGTGLLILALMVFRFVWRQLHPPPALPEAGNRLEAWRNFAATLTHLGFYVLVILQAVFGILQALFVDYQVRAYGLLALSELSPANADLARLFHVCHGTTGNLLLLLVLVHVGAALYHHFRLKDQVLRRMLPGTGRVG